MKFCSNVVGCYQK